MYLSCHSLAGCKIKCFFIATANADDVDDEDESATASASAADECVEITWPSSVLKAKVKVYLLLLV